MSVPVGTDKNWRISSYSGSNSQCVEVALGATVGVRDTKARADGQLAVPPAAWTALLERIR